MQQATPMPDPTSMPLRASRDSLLRARLARVRETRDELQARHYELELNRLLQGPSALHVELA